MSEDFDKIAEKICENAAKHEKQIKEYCDVTAACSFESLMLGYEQKAKEIDAEAFDDYSKESCPIDAFREIFQEFEKYPPSLHKPKKTAPKEVNRNLSVSRSQSMVDVTASTASLDKLQIMSPKKWDEGPSAVEIYKDFRKFKHALKELKALQNNDFKTKYINVLRKIENLANDVNKLYDTAYQDAEVALNHENANLFSQLVTNLENALYLSENKNLFNNSDQSQQLLQNLEDVFELLDYCFKKIGHFNDHKA